MSHLKVGLNEEISLDVEVAGKTQSVPIELEQYIGSVENLGFFDTGLLARPDTGLINYRRAAGWESFIFQVEAGEHMVIWGQYEGDNTASKLKVAMPYRIIMGDHQYSNGKWHLIGARHFYSPKPIKSWSDILYHCNVPNLNCRGYNGTGVGWICLYHTGNYDKMDLMQRCIETAMRTSGGEAYNDSNMSRTDGARFYQASSKPKHFWDKSSWAAKTKAEGWKWVLEDPNLFIPVKLNNPAVEMMAKHISSGKDASIFDLSRGLYSAYYNDKMYLKPANLMDPNNPFVKLYPKQQKNATYKYIKEFANTGVTQIKSVKVSGWTPKIKKLKCAYSGKLFSEDDRWNIFIDSDNVAKMIHSTIFREAQKAKGTPLVSANADLSKLKQSPDIPPEVLAPGAYPRSGIAGIVCRKEDVVTPPGGNVTPGGLTYNRYYHKTVETMVCKTCSNVVAKGTGRWPKDGGDVCTNCIGKVACPSCTRVIHESYLRTIEAINHDLDGTAKFKKALADALNEGKAVGELPSMKLGVSEKVSVVCCMHCSKAIVQCLCGNHIAQDKVHGLRKTKTKRYAATCVKCGPDQEGEMKLVAKVAAGTEVVSEFF